MAQVKVTLSIVYQGRTVSSATEVTTDEPLRDSLVELICAGTTGLQEALRLESSAKQGLWQRFKAQLDGLVSLLWAEAPQDR